MIQDAPPYTRSSEGTSRISPTSSRNLGVGQGLYRIEHIPVLWTGNTFEQIDLGIARENDPIHWFIHLATGQILNIDHQPPRSASRKSLTTARSTTRPANSRSSGAVPLNSGLSLDVASH